MNVTGDYVAGYEAGAAAALDYIADRWPELDRGSLAVPGEEEYELGVTEATARHIRGVVELLRRPLERP